MNPNPTIKPKLIAESTPEERRAYAINFLNLDITPSASDDDVHSAIRQAQPDVTTIFVAVQPDAPFILGTEPLPDAALAPEEQAGRSQGSLGRGDPRAVIFIQPVESADGTGNEDVYVGVNGRGWQLRRGVDLNVPWRVVEALDLTIQDIVRHRDDEGHEGEEVVTQAHRFPVTVRKAPSEEEVAAWHERTDELFCP